MSMPLEPHNEIASRLAAVVASSDDAIISTDLSGTVTSWNRAAERIFGYAEVEALGQSIRRIIPADLHDEDDQVLQRILTGGTVDHYDTVYARKDGGLVHVSVTVSPIRTNESVNVGVSRIARDITSRKQLERDANLLAAIVQSSDDAIVSKDLNGIVMSWNRAAVRMFGYTPAEMIGQSIRRLIPDDRQQEEDEVLARIRRGQHVEHYQTIRRRKDGTLLPISLTVSPVRNSDGVVIGASKIARDVSERERAELERQRLLQMAQEAGRLKDEFLATFSHELRTPLNAILGYARMIQSGRITGADQTRAVETIMRNATSLAQIVDDVLDVSRIIKGKIRLNVQPVDLAEVVRDALETVKPAADAKGVRVEMTADASGLTVAGDPDRLQQVMWNLLSNAVKFTGSAGQVHVRIARTNSHVEVTVSDTGIGIVPEFLPHVFERFRQADASTNRESGGLGIGLAITRHLVELQGGRISVSSDGRGRGATFRIQLPAMSVDADLADVVTS